MVFHSERELGGILFLVLFLIMWIIFNENITIREKQDMQIIEFNGNFCYTLMVISSSCEL